MFPELGIEYYKLNIDLPYSEQKPVDAILHKLSDQVGVPSEENDRMIAWFRETQKLHPNLMFIDNCEKLDIFVRRSYSYEVATQAIQNGHLSDVLSVPKYAVLPKGENIREFLEREKIALPILVKPEWQNGDSTHVIEVIISPSSLPVSYDIDMVIQEYKDHNGVIYKAYAIADKAFLEIRYSLPNVSDCDNPIDKYTIDRLKKCPLSFSKSAEVETKNNEIIHGKPVETESLTLELVTKYVTEIEKILQMDLIGVDFIVDSADPGRVFCIDVNLFPSFTGFPDVSRVFGEFILRKCAKCFVCCRDYLWMERQAVNCIPIVGKHN